MLMAAGLGTRLRPFTESEPKALLPVMGAPMAQFALDALAHAGVSRVVANIHHHAERSRPVFQALERGGMELVLSDESAELLGSSGGIRKAEPHFGDRPFFLVNADVLCDVDLQALARAHARNRECFGARLTLTVFPRGPRGGKYREILFDPRLGRITGLGEHREGAPFFVGAAVIEHEALAEIPMQGPSEFVPTILAPAIRDGKAGVFVADGIWHDVGSPSLWLKTHMDLIRALETRRLSLWSDRIEKINKRIAPGIWVSRDCTRKIRVSGWSAPAYYNPLKDETAPLLDGFGPDIALYGAAPGKVALTQGIGFKGIWVPVTASGA